MSTAPPARILTICNRRGLHARSSAKFVKCVAEFNAEVKVSRDGQTVSGASIMGLLMLGAAKGCDIEVSAEGPDAEAVLDALAALVSGGFEED
ncbi:MAG: HPr family phosphocarrier protein [Pseudomonadota bacterium]